MHGSMNVEDEMEWPCGRNRGLTNACRNLMGKHEAERYLTSRWGSWEDDIKTDRKNIR
jgi:hypothetical protein